MADVDIVVIDPAVSIDLITLDECKLLCGILPSDVSHDDYLIMQISIQSEMIFKACHRVFARETVEESWREMYTSESGTRLFLTHWPVAATDIQSVTVNGEVLDPTLWSLEPDSGKLSNYAGWVEPAVVTYTGGYLLPDEAPLPLKHATALLVNEARRQVILQSMEGIRSLSHKSARVQFFDPNALLLKTISAGGNTAAQIAVARILSRYMQTYV